MINGMWYYLFWILFVCCSLPFGELGPPKPLSRGFCYFLKFLTGQPDAGAIESQPGEEQEAEPFDMLFYSVDIILAQKYYNICSTDIQRWDEEYGTAITVESELVTVFYVAVNFFLSVLSDNVFYSTEKVV